MKNFISSVTILFLFLSSHSKNFAQSDFSLQIRGGATLKGESKILTHWNSGWNAGVGIEDELVSMVWISGFIGYHRFGFNMNSHPDWPFRWVGQNRLISSEGTNMYEVSLAFRFASDRDFIRPYVLLRSGLYIIHTGKIDFQQAQIGFTDEYTLDAQTTSRLFFAISIGVQIPITREWDLLIEPSFSQSPPSGFTLFPINAIVQYKL